MAIQNMVTHNAKNRQLQLCTLVHLGDEKMDAVLEPRQHLKNFCKYQRHATGLTGMELRTHYNSVLKEGCRKTADGTSALDVAIQRSLQRRPIVATVQVTSLEDSPNRPDNAARPSALGRHSRYAYRISFSVNHPALLRSPTSLHTSKNC